MEEDQILNYSSVEWLRDYFQPKLESSTKLPEPRSVVDGTEIVLSEDGIKTPHKMIDGKWHIMTVDADGIVKYKPEGEDTDFPAFGQISKLDNSTETTISVAGTGVQVDIFATDELYKNTTPDATNNHITIHKNGKYLILVSSTVNSIGGAGSRCVLTVRKNNGATVLSGLDVAHDFAGGGGESAPLSMSGLADLSPNDTIEVWIENETNTQNYIVEDISLTVIQVGV